MRRRGGQELQGMCCVGTDAVCTRALSCCVAVIGDWQDARVGCAHADACIVV